MFILDIATLSVDTVVEKLLKKQAKQVIEVAENLAKKTKNTDELEQLDEIVEHLDEIANGVALKRGKYLGQALENVDFEKIRNFLKKYKVDPLCIIKLE